MEGVKLVSKGKVQENKGQAGPAYPTISRPVHLSNTSSMVGQLKELSLLKSIALKQP